VRIAIAAATLMVAGCASDASASDRDPVDQSYWRAHGYDFADGVIEVDGEHGAAVIAECGLNADLLARISAQLVHRKGSADFVAECAVVPPGHGGVVGEAGLAEDG
jgi:hypothetical protein